MKILILNGPNLNLLGHRQPEIYGDTTLAASVDLLSATFPEVEIEHFQSNHEGDIIDRLQTTDADGIVLNAGGYTHTSVAIADAIAAIATPVVEVHISNIAAREPFRRESLISAVCVGTIAGFGIDSYRLGVEALLKR